MEHVAIFQVIADILEAMAQEMGVDRYDEPKHEIVGHPIGTQIHELQMILWNLQNK